MIKDLTENEKIALDEFIARQLWSDRIKSVTTWQTSDPGIVAGRIDLITNPNVFTNIEIETDGDMNVEVRDLGAHWC